MSATSGLGTKTNSTEILEFVKLEFDLAVQKEYINLQL